MARKKEEKQQFSVLDGLSFDFQQDIEPANQVDENSTQPVTAQSVEKPVASPLAIRHMTQGDVPWRSFGVTISEESIRFLRERSIELGATLQDYVYTLFCEEQERVRLHGIQIDLSLRARVEARHTRNRVKTIKMTAELVEWVHVAAAAHRMTLADYCNYIVYQEEEREKRDGRRPGKYDGYTL